MEVGAELEITNEFLKVTDYKGASFEIKINYCPSCGARMGKGAD
jgi:hypothetical protein